MTEQEIFEKLVTIVVNATEDEDIRNKITLETNVFNDLNISSFSFLYISMDIENVFGVRITNHDLEQLKTTRDFVNFIKEKVA